MKIRKSIQYLILLVGSASILAAGCSTFEVGIETIPPPTQKPAALPTNTVEPHIPEPTATEAAPAIIDVSPTSTEVPSLFPELVTIAHLTPYGSGDFGILVLEDGELTAQPSPVSFQIFWEYTPVTGKLAYSPEFVHASEQNNVPVTSLWVYDYETGESTMWLEDNVIRAAWSPDGERVAAAVYNPETEQIDLVFISGPDQVELIAECASNLFSWSPDGTQLAYVNAMDWSGVKEACAGTYLVSYPDGISAGEPQIERVSDFGSQKLLSGQVNDKPIWALDQNALIYPGQPFWVVPLDGSPAFVPQTPGGEEPMNLPRPYGSIWSSQLGQLIGNVDGMAGFGGLWVYQLSDDLTSIEKYYRIGETPVRDNSDVVLVSWWTPAESILVLNGDNVDPSQYLNELWRAPFVWSLVDRQWGDYP
jgi:hypothetical protein